MKSWQNELPVKQKRRKPVSEQHLRGREEEEAEGDDLIGSQRARAAVLATGPSCACQYEMRCCEKGSMLAFNPPLCHLEFWSFFNMGHVLSRTGNCPTKGKFV